MAHALEAYARLQAGERELVQLAVLAIADTAVWGVFGDLHAEQGSSHAEQRSSHAEQRSLHAELRSLHAELRTLLSCSGLSTVGTLALPPDPGCSAPPGRGLS